jgi:hypothetical protein
VSFDAPPGPLQIRLSVEGAGGAVLDTETREITVPDLRSPQTTFGTPEVFRARTIPELQRIKAEAQPTPIALRDFSRSDRLLIRAAIYGPAGETPTLTASLLNRAGQSLADVPVVPAAGGASGVRQLELALANLAPGDYAVALNASSSAGDARELVAFRVVP